MDIGPSRQMESWIVLVTACSLAACLASPVPTLAQAVLALVTLAAAVRAAALQGHREGRGAVRRFVVDLTGRIEVGTVDGALVTGRVLDRCFVAPWLTIVRWLPDGARLSRTIVLLPDMAGEQALRRLRVLLRWGNF